MEENQNIINIEDFKKIDLRVAKVLKAEKVENSDRLLRLEIDLGFEQRQILAGIALQYQPEEMIGKQIIVVANLAPRMLRGLESRGMLLAASDSTGQISLLTPSKDSEPGAKIN